MSKRIKIKVLALFIGAMLLTVSLVGLVGCEYPNNPRMDPKNPVVETDYFYVQLRRGDGYAVVFELTDLGKEQEILVIPEYVKGLPVRQVGWKKGVNQTGFKSEKLKKVYVPYTVTSLEGPALAFFQSVEIILLPSQSIKEYVFGGGAQGGKIYATEEFYSSHFENVNSIVWDGNGTFFFPNLIYYYNYADAPNLGYYWFDHITNDNVYVDPTEPTKEGYIFSGWYTELECITAWDGTKPTSDDEEIRVYADWKTA